MKLRAALQHMNSAEHLQVAASGIFIISIFSNGCLETSLKIIFMMWLKFQKQPMNAIFERRVLEIIKQHERKL